MFNELEGARNNYRGLIEKQNDAAQCVECGQCEASCPQKIQIIEKLKECHQYLLQAAGD